MAEYYGFEDPYLVTEMEEIAICNTAEIFDMLDKVIAIRVIVNTDIFSNDEGPESLWGNNANFNEKVESENSETLDVFEIAMNNLFIVSSVVIDNILDGTLN